jgi:Putative addiction module component
MANLTKSDIAALTVEQRLALIDDLWESIEGPQDARPAPECRREAPDQILDEEGRNPQSSVSWQDLRTKLTT